MNYQICKVRIDPFNIINLIIKYTFSDENNNIKLSILDKKSEINNVTDNNIVVKTTIDNINIDDTQQVDNIIIDDSVIMDEEYVKLSILVTYDQLNLHPELNGVVLTNILLLDNKVPSFNLKKTENFKYKKEIRKILENEYQLKSSDILAIKHINNNVYHNYIVILKNKNKAKTQYNYCIRCISKNQFLWKTIYSRIYKNNTVSDIDIYKYLCDLYLNDSKINKSFLINQNNYLNLSDIFLTLYDFTNKQ